MSKDEFIKEAERRFGKDFSHWRFVCPACKHVATVKDWRDAGAPEGAIAFSCVGRWMNVQRDAFKQAGAGPCNYAGGGLFGLNPMHVGDSHLFAFAEAPP